MALTDPIGDMLTRIRNAQMRRRDTVVTPASTARARVLDVLKSEGFIRGYTEQKSEAGLPELEIELKYSDNAPVIRTIERVSRPGRRVYASVKNIPSVANGLGVSIMSTPKGVMADHEAKSQNLGGEVLCRVF
jgi:small subunit ribosomal protein S8